MTCKDCLYSDLCRQNGTMMYYQHKGKQLMEDAEKACPWNMFKNKADYAEVKHGEWKFHEDGSGTCSECQSTQKNVWDYDNWQNFCGRCGAKMDGGKKE